MAKFLNTTGISYHLEELIRNTQDRLTDYSDKEIDSAIKNN